MIERDDPTTIRGPSPAVLSGLATFLMTDIEGSTRLWEEATVAMTVALEAHDTILRVAVESHGGRRGQDDRRRPRSPTSTIRSRRSRRPSRASER